MSKRSGEHYGCLVSGRVMNAAGGPTIDYLILTPEHGAFVNGVWYPAQSARITVEPDGRWLAVLLPSSVVGTYTVRIARDHFDMQVPDAAEAQFKDIATKSN